MAHPIWHYPRTELAKTVLDAFQNEAAHAYLLFARRRVGKTEFLIRDLMPMAEKRGWQCLYVDFNEGKSSPTMRLAHALGMILNKSSSHGGVKKLRIGAAEAEWYETKSRAAPAADDPYLLLDDMIESVCQRAKRTLFLFDEFQAAAQHPESSDFLDQVRASLNKRKTNIGTVFTGSSLTGLDAIFNDRKSPFFDFATRLPFEPFGYDFVDHCLAAFKRSTGRTLDRDKAIAAYDSLDRVTRNFREYLDVMMLEPDLSPDTAIERVRGRFRTDYRFDDAWIALTRKPQDQAVLALIANGETKLFSKSIAEKIKQLIGLTAPPTRSSIQSTLKRLARQGTLDKDQDGWRFVDPEFSRWIRERVDIDT